MKQHQFVEISSILNVLTQRPEGESYGILLHALVARLMVGCWADFLGLTKHFDEAEVERRFAVMRDIVVRGTEVHPAERVRLLECLKNAEEGIADLAYSSRVVEVGNCVGVISFHDDKADPAPGRVLS